ncbi:MAG: hypothetical protein ACQES9_06335 [Myxococcota bacterium]
MKPRNKQKFKYIAGLDEAGRGSLIGPMFLSLCAVDLRGYQDNLGNLRDSKYYGSSARGKKQRQELSLMIKQSTRVFIFEVPTEYIDYCLTHDRSLNNLEIEAARVMLSQLNNPGQTQIKADGERIFSPLVTEFPTLEAENKADDKYPITAAASIVAKTCRDQWMTDYYRRMDMPFECGGGGYPNQSTARFVDFYREKYDKFPPSYRHSWKKKPQKLPLF